MNQIIPSDADIMVVNQPVLGFLLKSDRLYQYIETNPHVAVGQDRLQSGALPAYVVTSSWSDDPYLKKYLALQEKYTDVFQMDRWQLYKKK